MPVRCTTGASAAVLTAAILAALLSASPSAARSGTVDPPQSRRADAVPFSFRDTDPSSARTLPFDARQLAEWVAAAWRHEPGRWDEAAERVSPWSPASLATLLVDLDGVRTAIAALLRKGGWTSVADPGIVNERVRVRGWTATPAEAMALVGLTPEEARMGGLERLVERGVILHTDVGVATADATSSSDVAHELVRTSLHLGFARALVRSLTKSSPDHPLARLWYRAVAAFLQLHREVSTAPLFVEEAVGLYPSDAFLLTSAGSVHEMLASPTVQSADYFRDSRLSPDIGPASSHLQKAERYFRRSLAIEPGQAVARVRLGRVLGATGRHADALAELRAVRPPRDDPFVRYFAWLFLGDEEASAGNRDAAHEAYGRALEIYPLAQSGWLAESRLARLSGDRAGAVDAMRKAAEIPEDAADDRYDPWNEYNAGMGREAPDLLRQLRAPQRRQP